MKIESLLLKNLKTLSTKQNISIQLHSIWSLTLHHLHDLDYDPKEYLPHVYGKFRERSAHVKVRQLLRTPGKGDLPGVASMTKIEAACSKYLPQLSEFGYGKKEIEKKWDGRACYKFMGGEDSGLKRMQEYIFEKKSIAHYDLTRNHLIGSEYSSKLSPWLANGSLSPRTVYFTTH